MEADESRGLAEYLDLVIEPAWLLLADRFLFFPLLPIPSPRAIEWHLWGRNKFAIAKGNEGGPGRARRYKRTRTSR